MASASGLCVLAVRILEFDIYKPGEEIVHSDCKREATALKRAQKSNVLDCAETKKCLWEHYHWGGKWGFTEIKMMDVTGNLTQCFAVLLKFLRFSYLFICGSTFVFLTDMRGVKLEQLWKHWVFTFTSSLNRIMKRWQQIMWGETSVEKGPQGWT